MRKNRTTPKPPAGSIADIAFLLLIFFMVVTSFHQEESISMKLPPEYNGPPGKVSEEKTVMIHINEENELMIEGELAELPITPTLDDHLKSILEKNNNAFIHIKMHPHSEYEYYLKTIADIKKSIVHTRGYYSQQLFGVSLSLLSESQKKYLYRKIKINVSESQIEIL